MKKLKISVALFFSIALLGACGKGENTTKESVTASVEKVSSSSSENTIQSTSQEESESDIVEYNQEITDDENVKITLMSIEHILDKEFDEEKYVISFDVTNKRDKTIAVQAREVSINDRMVDESLITMSTEISAGKSATAKLEIQDYSGGELPELTGNLELLLHTIDWDDYDYEHQVPVKITLK